MAFTQTELDTLKAAYASGVLTVRHASGHSVTYGSMSELWDAIQRIERSLTPAASRYKRGIVRFRRPC